MKNNRFLAILVSALLALAFSATSATAQTASPAAPAASAAKAPGKRVNPVEQRIATLHAQLKITAEQSGPWDAFAQTIRDNAKAMEGAFHARAKELPTMTAEESMESYARIAQLHADNMHRLAESFAKLYAVLSPSQKQIADGLFRGPHARRRR
jgi:Spy/CpxP family protein refolding chaperone